MNPNPPDVHYPAVPEDVSNDDAVINFTRGIRVATVKEIIGDGGGNISAENRELMLKCLDGLDRSALTTKRIKAETENADKQAQAATLIAELLMNQKLVNQFEVPGGTVIEAPRLSADLPDPDLVPGEIDVEPAQLDVTSFRKLMHN